MFNWITRMMAVPKILPQTDSRFLLRIGLWNLKSSINTNTSSFHPSAISSSRYLTTAQLQLNKDEITVHFRKKSGKILSGVGKEGENLLDVVVNNNLDFDGFGACEGTLACSTCHLILNQADYDKLNSMPTDEELDMLDLAYGLTDTSRLGCQVRLTKELDGMTVDVPEGINDVRSDS